MKWNYSKKPDSVFIPAFEEDDSKLGKKVKMAEIQKEYQERNKTVPQQAQELEITRDMRGRGFELNEDQFKILLARRVEEAGELNEQEIIKLNERLALEQQRYETLKKKLLLSKLDEGAEAGVIKADVKAIDKKALAEMTISGSKEAQDIALSQAQREKEKKSRRRDSTSPTRPDGLAAFYAAQSEKQQSENRITDEVRRSSKSTPFQKPPAKKIGAIKVQSSEMDTVASTESDSSYQSAQSSVTKTEEKQEEPVGTL